MLRRDESRHDPHLAPERVDQLLDVVDTRLDLDQEEGPARVVPRDDVHGTALAEVVEAPLGRDIPALANQCAHGDLHESGVLLVQQPRPVAAAPPGVDARADLQYVADPAHGADRDTFEPTELDLGDPALTAAGLRRDVDLPPASLASNGANQPSHTFVFHARILTIAVARAINRGSPPAQLGVGACSATRPVRPSARPLHAA